MRARTTSTTFLIPLLLLATAATASARPADVPTLTEHTLAGFQAAAPILRVIPNSSVDVLFYNRDRAETWIWDINNQTTSFLTSDYVKAGQAHGHFAATYRIGRFDILDFRTHQFTHHSPSTGGQMAVHGNWMAWEHRTSGLGLLNLSTGTEVILADGSSAGSPTIYGDWLVFQQSDWDRTWSRIAVIQLSTQRDYGFVDPNLGIPHVGVGKIIYTKSDRVTWEYIGQPTTRQQVELQTECGSTRNHRPGGTNSQLVAYVATDCPSGYNELYVINVHTSNMFYVGSTKFVSDVFDIQGNVISFADESEAIRVLIIDEALAR